MKAWHWVVIGIGSTGALIGALWLRAKAGGAVAGADDRAGPDKKVPGKPEDLARLAGVDVDVYSLARCMEREETSQAGRIAVGWVTRNEARREKISVTKLLTRSTVKDTKTGKVSVAFGDGFYGSQELHKWAATTNPPSAGSIELAKKILAEPPKISDPTGGATQWDAPEAQDALHKKDPKKYKTSAEIATLRQAAGKKMVMVAGVPKTRFWA
jgi:hypothetical protein